jgi:drug/metabolite transporter (DMT)-like permease
MADLGLLLVTAIWGATFVMVKDAVAEFPVFAFLALRFWLALLALVPFAVARGLRWRRGDADAPAGHLRPLSSAMLRAGLLIGLALFSGYAFQTFGLRYTTAAKAGFITGLSVVIVPVMATILMRRPPTRSAAGGVVLATIGLGLLSLRGDLSVALGDLLVLLCAVSFACHIIAVGTYAPRMDSFSLVAVQIATVAVLSTLAALIIEGSLPSLTPNVLIAAGFTGLAATSLAYGIQTIAQRFAAPTHTALIFSLEPVWAGIFSFWLAGEVLGPRAMIACGLILIGMLVAEMVPALRSGRSRVADRLASRAHEASETAEYSSASHA